MDTYISRLKCIKYFFVFLACIFTLALPRFCFASELFQVTIDNVDKKAVSEYVLNDLVRTGYSLINTNEYQVIVRKDLDSFGAMMFGSNFNRTPELRVHYNFIQNGNNTTITSEVKIVTNPNSGFEKYTNVTHKSWQEYLNSIKRYFNGYVGYGLSWAEKKKSGCLEVIHITPEGPAAKSGLKVGDLIATVNSVTVEDTGMKKINEIFNAGSNGTVLTVSLKNQLGKKTLIMTKDFIPPVYKKPGPGLQQSDQKPVFGLTNGPPNANGNIPIIAITAGSSAERAGLKAGDIITFINGSPASQYTPSKFNEAFAGPAGTKVELTIVSVNGTEKNVTLEKAYIIQQNDL